MENRQLIIVGSARGVNRFKVINQVMIENPSAKVINTSQLIKSIINDFNLPELDKIPLLDYFRFVEPALTKTILSHLDHENVILDTTFYYLLPGISAREILKFSGKIKSVSLILVYDNVENILSNNNDDWFKTPKNIHEDLLLNKYSFKFYDSLFSSFVKVFSTEINLNEVKSGEKFVFKKSDFYG